MLSLLLSIVLSIAAPARAAAWPDLSSQIQPTNEGRNDAAVVIAIEDYTKVDDVVGARANADDWIRYLVAGRGLSASRVFKATDGDATDVKIRELARQAAAEVRPGGTLWFVFIGHGAPSRDGRDGLLVGADADRSADGLYARSVSRTELLALLDAGPQSQTVALIDACFSGQSGSGKALVDGLQPMIPTALSTSVARRAHVLTAAGSGEFAGPLPGAARPAFSYLALGGLMGWADAEGDGNQDGKVSAEELRAYVRGALNLTVTGRSQTPSLLGEDAVLASAMTAKAPSLMAEPIVTTAAGGGLAQMAAAATTRRQRIDAAAEALRDSAARDYAAIAPLLGQGPPPAQALPVLDAFLHQYSRASVTVDGETEAVDVPELEPVREALQRSPLGLEVGPLVRDGDGWVAKAQLDAGLQEPIRFTSSRELRQEAAALGCDQGRQIRNSVLFASTGAMVAGAGGWVVAAGESWATGMGWIYILGGGAVTVTGTSMGIQRAARLPQECISNKPREDVRAALKN